MDAASNGAPIETSLGVLVRATIDWLGENTRAAFYLADASGTSLRHVVGMPGAYADAVNGFPIGPASLACGLAAHTGQPVITSDVRKDERWNAWLWMAEWFDYRGCWSFPIGMMPGRRSVGTFAIYSRLPRVPTKRELDRMSLVTQTAFVIISMHAHSNAGMATLRTL